MVLRKSFYIRWSAGRSPRVHEVNPGQDPSLFLFIGLINLGSKFQLEFVGFGAGPYGFIVATIVKVSRH